MKRIFLLMFACCLMLMFSACTNNSTNDNESFGGTQSGSETQQPEEEKPEQPDETPNENETQQPNEDEKEIKAMYLYVNDNKLEVTLAENQAVNALVEILKQGDITYTAHANSFEIYGDIGHSLPTDNAQITSQAGDVLLWAGSNICIFFGNNSYSYTRLGKINGYSASQLRTLLGAGNGSVQVTISLR